MKYEFKFDLMPIGYAAEFHPKGSTELLPVDFRGFYTMNDGDAFIHALEGVSEAYLSKIPIEKRPAESQIGIFLAIIKRDKSCIVYIDEQPLTAIVIPKCDAKKGDPVRSDDIGAVIRAKIKDIEIPKDAGFVAIISAGWRKGILFDYSPILPNGGKEREFDVEVALGQAWSFLNFQDRLKISDAQWTEFFRQHWFPFMTLSGKLLKTMKAYSKRGLNMDDLIDEIRLEVLSHCPTLLNIVNRSEDLKPHKELINLAIEHFRNGDNISCVSILQIRIEGVMRTWNTKVGTDTQTKPKDLIKSVTTAKTGSPIEGALLFPPNFERFLSEVYFENFGLGDVDKASRHTVAHGVAPIEKFDLKAALLSILILEQITYFMSVGNAQTN